ncbi:hypothetical protein NA57DRAFT_73448 [Rhizodiscina lignyota]|uniref:Kinetochore protein mis14 n=1 Tax=Rhizodiscina lignyota TaxID=1504668 RepID=A0A9P4MDV9_9PEZI|nr:hypothetical protein NA57DRAFT_73448 [Rhizodiscina lignyota]
MATAARSEHRKIDLQSPADLAYIHSHMSRSARDKIDRALPPAAAPAGEEDKLRRRVEELVDGYVKSLWEGVRMNVRVNGIDAAEGSEGDVRMGGVEDDLEPFDHRLADRIRALEAQKEALTERVADLRRTAPAAAATTFEAQFLHESEMLDKEARDAEEEAVKQAVESRIELDVAALERWDDVKRTWERGAEGLVALKGSLGETRAKVERVGSVVGYVEGRG